MNQTPTYDHTFSDETAEAFAKAIQSPDQLKYSLQIEGDLGFPPVRDALRYLSVMRGQGGDEELEDRIVHYCFVGKTTTVLLDGKPVGSFRINSLQDDWDAFPVFVEHPLAFGIVQNVATWSVIKKLTPPLRNELPQPAARKGS